MNVAIGILMEYLSIKHRFIMYAKLAFLAQLVLENNIAIGLLTFGYVELNQTNFDIITTFVYFIVHVYCHEFLSVLLEKK